MRRRMLLLGASGLAATTGAALIGVLSLAGADSYEPVPLSGPLAQQIDIGSGTPPRTPGPAGADVEVGPPAPSPAEAVDRFIAAEIDQRFGASFELLSHQDRAEHATAEGWRQAHHELPRLVASRTVGGPDADVVVTEATLQPRLDRTVGAVPARARISWRVVPEDGGWRLAYSESTIEAHYPDDAGADDAVQVWAEAARRCQDTRPLEVGSGLVGVTGYALRLCGAAAPATAGAVERLEALDDPAVALSAFGSDAAAFIRVVDLEGPVPMRVLTAPEGERWLVVGLAAPSR